MTEPTTDAAIARRAGAQWRILVHEPHGRSIHIGHAHAPTREHFESVAFPSAEFDELVVGQWIHLEQMDIGLWWMNVAGLTISVRVDRDGRPTKVEWYPPGEDDDPVPGVTYQSRQEVKPQ